MVLDLQIEKTLVKKNLYSDYLVSVVQSLIIKIETIYQSEQMWKQEKMCVKSHRTIQCYRENSTLEMCYFNQFNSSPLQEVGLTKLIFLSFSIGSDYFLRKL